MSNFNKLKQYATNLKKPDPSIIMTSEISHAPKEVLEYEDKKNQLTIEKDSTKKLVEDKASASKKTKFNPKKTKKLVENFRVDSAILEQIKIFCKNQDITRTEFYARAVEECLKLNKN